MKLVNTISEMFPTLGRWINKFVINMLVNKSRHRPHPWSTVHDYVSWTSLTDKNWSARHLPAKTLNPPKQDDAIIDLFKRADGPQLCDKSTCLFPAFAQYLTDGFIRTRMPNKSLGEKDDPVRKQNTSNHDIDLSPLYGRTGAQTDALRLNSETKGERGRLKSQIVGGTEEYAPYLFENGKIKQEFEILDTPLMLDKFAEYPDILSKIFAFGGDRANASPQVSMMNTLFLREHNRLAKEIEQLHPNWDDTRVFETARNTNIVLFIKIVIEEYINNISSGFKFRTDPSVAWNAPWNKPNWITSEFSLLYRWHPLIPDSMKWGGVDYPTQATIMNNNLLISGGLKQSFIDMSTQSAGKIGPFNTSDALIRFEKMAIDQGRLVQLASYGDYREYVNLSRPTKFSDISKNPKVVSILERAYDKVDDVEFYVGMFSEDSIPNSPLPELIGIMVAVDAFSQALTNPLLSEHVWKQETFSSVGWDAINTTKNLESIVNRNVAGGVSTDDFIGITRKGWKSV